MKFLLPTFAITLMAGCATGVEHPVDNGAPDSSEIRKAFSAIVNPYPEDAFATHAYADGFIHAYALGPGALGALFATPEPYREKAAEEAYRAGWRDGALLISNQK